MRNITAFLSLVIIFFYAQVLSAQEENPYAVNLGYQFGFLYGQAEEVVYPYNGIKAELLSQLLWDMKPVYYNGLVLDFSQAQPLRKWGFFGVLSFKYGIPAGSGKMEDRDWMSMENAALTNFSRHDNIAREIFLADFSAGLSFPLFRFMLIKPFLSVSYMRFSFSGTDGYGTYAREDPPKSGKYHPIDANPIKMEFSGKVITYTQEWLYAAAGFSLTFIAHDTFSAELSFQISPLTSYAGLDEHLLTKVQYRDYTEFGLLLQPSAALSFSPVRWLSLSLDCSWKYVSKTKGDSYNRSYGTGFYEQQGEAGAGLSIIDTSLLVTIRLSNNSKPADPYHRLMR